MNEHLAGYGWTQTWADRLAAHLGTAEGQEIEGPQPGRVVRHDGAGLMVAVADGVVRSMFGRAVDPPPVVGDWVVLDRNQTPMATLPRDSLLRRRAAGNNEKEQPLVANVDVVLAVCGLDRPVRAGRIQRTIAIATDAGAQTVVVLTKSDLVDPGAAAMAEMIATEVDASLEVVTLSAKGGYGVADLLERVGTRTVALIGESGAGKSTLVNALMAGEVAAEGRVREGDAKGRHTTTSRELHLLDTGGVLVDTPGIREVGVWSDPDAVAETFPEIEELAASCRFHDCAHQEEPGYAVLAAAESGDLAPERLQAWRTLEAEVASAELRADEVAYRRKGRQLGRMYREAKKAKDDDRKPPE